jgi:hypothetical protein
MEWVEKVTLVPAASLLLLQVSIKAGLNLTLDLDGRASNLLYKIRITSRSYSRRFRLS